MTTASSRRGSGRGSDGGLEPPVDEGGRPSRTSSTRAEGTARRQTSSGRPTSVLEQGTELLTAAHGAVLSETDNTLRVGARGPALLEDFHLREKIMRFDHERIPERVVHARGAGAHGVFRAYESHDDLTRAGFLTNPDVETPVFVRFSTVLGSRGSADTARDVRGFAVRFYTGEGNFDLVGNNIPVFFIQDGIKFPDLVHAGKPEQDREIPQAQSAHDTFWDFASLLPESTHMLMWVMSDRGIPRSYRTMEGFGVHTFRLSDADGETSLVKFHWKPLAGVHGLVWEEAQKLGGVDPDFHRRDLWDAIESGARPEWELGVQVMPDSDDQTFEGIDLLDPTKIVPETLCPVRPLGRMTLYRNPDNFFAETEQVAFHVGHLVPGIDVTDDPLLHARLFSYLDTQLTRLGGPNFGQLPINRPHVPINTNTRDGFGQSAIPSGKVAYTPNTVGGGCPYAHPDGYVHAPRAVTGEKVRERPASFEDHFSQATLYFESLSPPEADHVAEAFAFELSKVLDEDVRMRVLRLLANVDSALCEHVAAALGLAAPDGSPERSVTTDPTLSMQYQRFEVPDGQWLAGRTVAIIADDGSDLRGMGTARRGLQAAGATVLVVAPHAGTVTNGKRSLVVDKTLLSCESVEFDAVVLANGTAAGADAGLLLFVQEAHRHAKPLGAWGDGCDVLVSAAVEGPGVATSTSMNATFVDELVETFAVHRYWERQPPLLPGDGDDRTRR